MWSGQASTYNTKYRARTLAAYNNESAERHLFLVGTTALREENEIHVIEYVEESGNIVCRQIFNHPSEIWDLKPCPERSDLLFTALNTGSTMKGTLWELPNDLGGPEGDDSGNNNKIAERVNMKSIITLNENSSDSIGAGVWDSNKIRLLTWPGTNVVGDLLVWDIDSNNSANISHTIQNDNNNNNNENTTIPLIYAAAWDPHRASTLAVAKGDNIVGYDIRTPSSETTFSIPTAHGLCTRDLDYNPNKPYCFLSGGDDGKIKFWDYRKTNAPLKVLSGHSHWVTRTKYNPFHDQLVVSAGTDSSVALWRAASISSAPLLELDDDDEEDDDEEDEITKKDVEPNDGDIDSAKDITDAMIRRFDEHEDSVYGLAWSLCDAWVFSSLSYDGRVVVNHVPSAEKYKILL